MADNARRRAKVPVSEDRPRRTIRKFRARRYAQTTPFRPKAMENKNAPVRKNGPMRLGKSR
jgi:hypothetical protein